MLLWDNFLKFALQMLLLLFDPIDFLKQVMQLCATLLASIFVEEQIDGIPGWWSLRQFRTEHFSLRSARARQVRLIRCCFISHDHLNFGTFMLLSHIFAGTGVHIVRNRGPDLNALARRPRTGLKAWIGLFYAAAHGISDTTALKLRRKNCGGDISCFIADDKPGVRAVCQLNHFRWIRRARWVFLEDRGFAVLGIVFGC